MTINNTLNMRINSYIMRITKNRTGKKIAVTANALI